MKIASCSAFALLLVSACASGGGSENIRPRSAGMSIGEAQEVVADFEKDLAKHDQMDPLRQPRSLDDVTEILKRDQIDLFPAGVAFASQQTSVEAKVLQAQIEIAWGEAQLTLADLFAELAATSQTQLRRIDPSADLPADQAAERESLRKKVVRQTNITDALTRLAAEHVAAGATIAKQIIADSPNDYLGYRLAADYYRMRGDWAKFDEMVAKIQATNPQSNGLLFLRAMSAIQHHGRNDEGQDLLKQALAKDPKFARAQSELVLTTKSIDKKNEQLQALKALNPNHQVVVWVGPHIEMAYLKAQ
jgi:hypothetical protein